MAAKLIRLLEAKGLRFEYNKTLHSEIIPNPDEFISRVFPLKCWAHVRYKNQRIIIPSSMYKPFTLVLESINVTPYTDITFTQFHQCSNILLKVGLHSLRVVFINHKFYYSLVVGQYNGTRNIPSELLRDAILDRYVQIPLSYTNKIINYYTKIFPLDFMPEEEDAINKLLQLLRTHKMFRFKLSRIFRSETIWCVIDAQLRDQLEVVTKKYLLRPPPLLRSGTIRYEIHRPFSVYKKLWHLAVLQNGFKIVLRYKVPLDLVKMILSFTFTFEIN